MLAVIIILLAVSGVFIDDWEEGLEESCLCRWSHIFYVGVQRLNINSIGAYEIADISYFPLSWI